MPRIGSHLWGFAAPSTLIIFLISLIATCLLILGSSKLEVENKFIDYFDSSTEIYQGMLKIDTDLGGTATLDIIISEPSNNFIDDFFYDQCHHTPLGSTLLAKEIYQFLKELSASFSSPVLADTWNLCLTLFGAKVAFSRHSKPYIP